MRRDFVEENERRQSAHCGYEPYVGQNQSGKERLLLARRGLRRQNLLWPVAHAKIGCLRANQRASCLRVAKPIFPQRGSINIFGLNRRVPAYEALDFALQRKTGPGKSRSVVRSFRVAAAIAMASSAASFSIASSRPGHDGWWRDGRIDASAEIQGPRGRSHEVRRDRQRLPEALPRASLMVIEGRVAPSISPISRRRAVSDKLSRLLIGRAMNTVILFRK
jgi:hypothetical protein